MHASCSIKVYGGVSAWERRHSGFEGQSVVLVDDVAARGYTLRACSERLREAGARRVVCVVLAQSVTTLREQREAQMSGHVLPL